MCLLVGQGIGALLCTSNFGMGRHCTVHIMHNTSFFFAISSMNVDDIDTYFLMLFSISNFQTALLCLLRFWAPLRVVLTTGPSHSSAPVRSLGNPLGI